MLASLAYRVFLIEAGASAFFRMTIYTALAIYYVREVGLNPFQLVLVGTTIEITCFLLQVPTGVIADVYSRRLSVIIGELLVGVCFLIEGSFPAFAAILFAEVIRGVGETCIDGALQAWIADEVGEDHLDRVFLRGSQVASAGWLLGPLAGAGLATIDLRLPILLGGGLMVALGIFLVLIMPETRFQPTHGHDSGGWRNAGASMMATVRDANVLVRASPILAILLAVSLVFGASSEGMDRLWEAHLLTDLTMPSLGGFDPILWFGIINAVGAALGIVIAQMVVPRIDTRHDAKTARMLVIATGVFATATVVFGLARSFPFALFALWCRGMAGALMGPISSAWLNRQIDSRVRATVLSANSQADALGQLTGGPAIGAVGTLFSLRAAIAICGLILTPAMLLYGMAIKRDRELIPAVVLETQEAG